MDPHQNLQAVVDWMHAAVDRALARCPDGECAECSRIMCPHKHEFHFHHDGCPACAR